MKRWTTCELIFFDCDSTLSSIEGIDELARLKGKEERVGLLTKKAMDGDLDLDDVYAKRLRAIKPTRQQLDAIEDLYARTLVPDAEEVLKALQFIKKHVFIISGGLLDAVKGFGKRLGVALEHIRAVELEYNELSGEWWRYHDHKVQREQTYLDYNGSPLTASSGKPEIVRELAGQLWGERMMVGDGTSDLATRNNGVSLFVGFGGVAVREKVEKEADVFLYENTLAPILPLATGATGMKFLKGTPFESLFQRGLKIALSAEKTRFRDSAMREAFKKEFAIPDLSSESDS